MMHDIIIWGKLKENGIWMATTSYCRFMWRGHDALYIAFWRLRLRIMKDISDWFRGKK